MKRFCLLVLAGLLVAAAGAVHADDHHHHHYHGGYRWGFGIGFAPVAPVYVAPPAPVPVYVPPPAPPVVVRPVPQPVYPVYRYYGPGIYFGFH